MTARLPAPPPHPRHGSLPDPNDEDLMIPDQDDAQAVLQPAMSAAASHLTSSHTPAVEKAAALERAPGSEFFDGPHGHGDGDADEDGDGDADPAPSSTFPPSRTAASGPSRGHQQQHLGLPSPWQARPRAHHHHHHHDVSAKDGARSSETRGVLGAALGPPRQRSRSAGQEALKKLQQAFPSLSAPTHLLPSLPKSFLSGFTDGKQSHHRASPRRSQAQAPEQQTRSRSRALSSNEAVESGASTPSGSRPPLLRRVTSDDSMLYHTLSRASSLGDDDRFLDVREMVNIRLMAIRDSLPDVPNFKMPSLAKLQAASRRSTMSLNGIFSSEPGVGSRQNTDREAGHAAAAATPSSSFSFSSSSSSKDDSTALDRVLEELTGDIVIMGGYRGSILRSAEPPHQQLWAPVKLGLNMRKVNLEVGLDDEDEETMEERIVPSGMLQHIGPIDVSRRFFKKLRACDNARAGRLRVWDYGYDWRLSPARLSRRLQEFLQTLPSNQPSNGSGSGSGSGDGNGNGNGRGAIVVAHSLGGLITRHAVNQRPDLFAGVLYAGTPQRCVNILGPMRNGDAVLFNDKLLTAQVNFSIRTSFALLPDDGFCFVDRATGEEYAVDFYDPESWVRWRLSPCVAPPPLPPYNRPPAHSSTLSSLLPNSLLRPRGDGRSERKGADVVAGSSFSSNSNHHHHHHHHQHHHHQSVTSTSPSSSSSSSPSPSPSSSFPSSSPSSPTSALDPERRRRNLEYLARTLSSIRRFRSELAHSPALQSANAYPPLAVIYGKSIPTVHAARVSGRDAIPCADAYDDLVFRPGDGVVLAKEAMLPDGYAVVRGGRVSTERGHITMLGDMPALGRALGALLRGRRKGIGMGAVAPGGSGSGSSGTTTTS